MSSSTKRKNFSLQAINTNAIKLLNNQNYLVYDGIRVKWTNDLCSLQNFIEIVVGLTGKWNSPGGTAKRFTDSNSKFIMTWYPGKQNTLTFNGKEGESFKKILASILDTNCVIKQTNTISGSSLQVTTKISAANSHIIDNNLVTKDSASLIYNWSCNTHVKDIEFNLIADNSTLEELEDFIDSAYYIVNVAATPNFARAAGNSTPRRTDDTQTIVEAQFLAFKENVESQIEKLSTIVSEQNHTINTNKLELCQLKSKNLNLKSRIFDLEEKIMSFDDPFGSNIKQHLNNFVSYRPSNLRPSNSASPITSKLVHNLISPQLQVPVATLDEKPTNSPDNCNVNQPLNALSTSTNVDNLPAEEGQPTVNTEIRSNALLSAQQLKTRINSSAKNYSLSFNCELLQTKNVLNYLPLCEDLSITEDNLNNSTFDKSDLNQHEQDNG